MGHDTVFGYTLWAKVQDLVMRYELFFLAQDLVMRCGPYAKPITRAQKYRTVFKEL
jgi:hypothetical protein